MEIKGKKFCKQCGRPWGSREADAGYDKTRCGACGYPSGLQYEKRKELPRRLFHSPDSGNFVQMAAPLGGWQGSVAGWMSSAGEIDGSSPAGRPMPQEASQICNACGYAMPPSDIGQTCKRCGYMGLPNEPQPERPVPLQVAQMARDTAIPFPVTQASVRQVNSPPSTNAHAPVFQPIAQSSPIANPGQPAQQGGRGLEMSHVPFREMPEGQSKSPKRGLQICFACGYDMSQRNIPCKQCGYTGFPNQPQPQRPVILQEPQMVPTSHVPPAGVSRGQPEPPEQCLNCCFQPNVQGQQGGLLPQPVAARNEMQGVQNAAPAPDQRMYSGGPNRWQPEECQRCCSARVPDRTVVPDRRVVPDREIVPDRTVVPDRAIVPDRAVVPDREIVPDRTVVPDREIVPDRTVVPDREIVPDRTVVSDRAIVSNVVPVTPVSYRLLDSLESVSLGGNARGGGGVGGGGGGGGGGGNEFFLLDETSGKAERWQLLPSAIYSIKSAQGATGTNLQRRSSVSPTQGRQSVGALHQQPVDLWQPAEPSSFRKALDTDANKSAVYVRLPDPSAQSTPLATGPQLVRQAAMLELSQRAGESPAVFVRLTPIAGNVAPQSLQPQAARPFPPPNTQFGKLALQALQDVGDENRRLEQQSSAFLKKYRRYLLRTEAARQKPRTKISDFGEYSYLRRNRPPEASDAEDSQDAASESASRDISTPASAARRPLPASERRASVSVSTQTGLHSRRAASPAAEHHSQDEG